VPCLSYLLCLAARAAAGQQHTALSTAAAAKAYIWEGHTPLLDGRAARWAAFTGSRCLAFSQGRETEKFCGGREGVLDFLWESAGIFGKSWGNGCDAHLVQVVGGTVG
jgi:hypothetical protein